MLEMENINFEKEAVETSSEQNNQEKNQLLMKVLELNEELNDIESKDQIKSFEDELNVILSPLEKEFESAYVKQDFHLAVQVLAKMKYFRNIEQRLEELKLNFDLSEL